MDKADKAALVELWADAKGMMCGRTKYSDIVFAVAVPIAGNRLVA